MGKKLVTRHVFPPIPIRTHDWCAYPEGEEENGGYGWGPTEEAAIADWYNINPDEVEGGLFEKLVQLKKGHPTARIVTDVGRSSASGWGDLRGVELVVGLDGEVVIELEFY